MNFFIKTSFHQHVGVLAFKSFQTETLKNARLGKHRLVYLQRQVVNKRMTVGSAASKRESSNGSCLIAILSRFLFKIGPANVYRQCLAYLSSSQF